MESWNSKARALRVSGSPGGSLGEMVSGVTPASPLYFYQGLASHLPGLSITPLKCPLHPEEWRPNFGEVDYKMTPRCSLIQSRAPSAPGSDATTGSCNLVPILTPLLSQRTSQGRILHQLSYAVNMGVHNLFKVMFCFFHINTQQWNCWII